jgi:hypothetical protein
MASAQGLLGLAAILAVAFLVSADRRAISIRTVGVGLALQFAFALAVLRWNPGRDALKWFAGKVASLIGYTNQGSQFLFGPKLVGGKDTIFAFQVLPVIIFLAALSAVGQSTPRITSDALTIAVTAAPAARPSSRTASVVIEATRRCPPASRTTVAAASPWVIETTLAGIWLRALSCIPA